MAEKNRSYDSGNGGFSNLVGTDMQECSGSEEEFVREMNQRAKEIEMEHTHFTDYCGLTESKDHYTTAYDIALMSRELITKYPKILEYSSIWMENITHKTRQGTKEFGLTNTNKLLRSYEGCVGLKTGSTSSCLSRYLSLFFYRRNCTRQNKNKNKDS